MERTGSGGVRAASNPLHSTPSFHVLNLLAELLDHRLKLKADLRERHVVGLGAQGIRLPAELLSEKIEPATDGAAFPEQSSGGLHVRPQPVELFADIRASGDQHRLLMETSGVESGLAFEQLIDLSLQAHPDSLRATGWRRIVLIDKA